MPSPGEKHKNVPSSSSPKHFRCVVLVNKCIAIQLERLPKALKEVHPQGTVRKNNTIERNVGNRTIQNGGTISPIGSTTSSGSNSSGSTTPTRAANDVLSDNGFLLFQGFQECNLRCFWNPPLLEAIKALEYRGYLCPATLLVTANQGHLEVIRGAWARRVLKAPTNYTINVVGDVDDCIAEPILQGQFTPLPEALCWVILELTSAGQVAFMDAICTTLLQTFPAMMKPNRELIYATLEKLIRERRVYQTAHGYFIVTPDTLRYMTGLDDPSKKSMLMSNEEAITYMHGAVESTREGHCVHEAIQTNLRDVFGTEPGDKILYGHCKDSRRGRLERHNSLKLFRGNKSLTLKESSKAGGSLKLSPTRSRQLASLLGEWEEEDYLHVEKPHDDTEVPVKERQSMFSRLFRRSQGKGNKRPPTATFSAQFPPTDWSDSGVSHLHSVATQTKLCKTRVKHLESSSSESTHSMEEHRSASHLSIRWEDELSLKSGATLPLPRKKISSHLLTPGIEESQQKSQTIPSAIQIASSSPPTPSQGSPSRASSVYLSQSRASSIYQSINESSTYQSPSRASSSIDSQRNSGYYSPASYNNSPQNYMTDNQSPKHKPFSSNHSSPIHQANSSQRLRPPYMMPNSIPQSLGYNSRDPPPNIQYSPVKESFNTVRYKSIAPVYNSPLQYTPQYSPNKIFLTGQPTSFTTLPQTTSSTITEKKAFPVKQPPALTTQTHSTTKAPAIFTSVTCSVKSHHSPTKTYIICQPSSTKGESAANKGNSGEKSVNNQNKQMAEFIVNPVKVVKLERPTSLYGVKNTTDVNVADVKKPQSEPSSPAKLETSNNVRGKTLVLNCSSSHPNEKFCNKQDSGMTSVEVSMNNHSNRLSSSGKCEPLSFKNMLHDMESRKSLSKTCEFIENINKTSKEEKSDNSDISPLDDTNSMCTYPSLSDLTVNFKSITGQRIMKGVSVNSIDTLLEVNMVAEQKPNNCEVADLGVV